jgi:polyketide cyclase/dehydrase/lipid transport protein
VTPKPVKASAIVDAPAAVVYGIIADYRDGHPHILPKSYFTALEVEAGGVGTGTVIRVTMRVLGSTRTFRAAVTEPEPGRVLVERDLESGTTTTFTVEPVDGGAGTRVTFETELGRRGGVAGWLESVLTPSLLKPIYAQELELLRQVAVQRARQARGARSAQS